MDPQSPSPKDHEGVRENLLARRRTLAGDVDHLSDEVRSGDPIHLRSELADMGQEAAVQDMSLSRIASEEDEIYLIDEALRKIEEGAYGLCEECDKPINPERLEALPHARLCIECQRVQESRSG